VWRALANRTGGLLSANRAFISKGKECELLSKFPIEGFNMPLRSILLRVLFVSLALAAVFGAAGILFGSHDTIWRISATSVATALGALLLLVASPKVDKLAARPSALLAITLIVLEYLLTLMAIWEQGFFFSSSNNESLWLTILFIALVGIPAIGLMRMTRTALTAVAGSVGLALAVVELFMLLLIAWDQFPWTREFIAEELAGWLPPCALLIVGCLVGRGGGWWRAGRWLGAATAGLAYSLIAYGVIHDIHRGAQIVTYITCIAAALTYANVVLLCPLQPAQIWLRWLTIASGVATSLFVSASTYLGPYSNDVADRLAGACGIVAGCGLLALLVLARLNRRMLIAPNAMQDLREITLVCPVCKKKQTLPLGTAACADCRALIHIRIEDPKCATCGYSLLMLQSTVCPECGTPIETGIRGNSKGSGVDSSAFIARG
jgi:hypothetical protein